MKFVGLFVILLAGLATIQDLWSLLGDLTLTKVGELETSVSIVSLYSTNRQHLFVVITKFFRATHHIKVTPCCRPIFLRTFSNGIFALLGSKVFV